MAKLSRKGKSDDCSSSLSSNSQAKIPLVSSYAELACSLSVIVTPVLIYYLYISSPAARPDTLLTPSRSETVLEEDPVLPFCKSPWNFLSEHSLLDCAARTARLHFVRESSRPRRLAFLFLSRNHLPHEDLWRRFFLGHDQLYSIYVHTHPRFTFPNSSLFYGHQIPSEPVQRLSISLVDAMRRLMAYAVLDPEHGSENSWFVFACEVTIPIRSFAFTYEYLTKSRHSFVESFAPVKWYSRWETLPEFERWRLRKGEVWMALQLRHAALLLADWSLYYKFRSDCSWGCNPDETYVPTLLGLLDPEGIANRTIMYVNWTGNHGSSPKAFQARDVSPEWVQEVQARRVDSDGQYHDTSVDRELRNVSRVTRKCYYNGVADSPCFLLVRKVAKNASPVLGSFTQNVLGY